MSISNGSIEISTIINIKNFFKKVVDNVDKSGIIKLYQKGKQ